MEKEKKNFLERFRGKQINVNVPISIIMLAASIFLGFYVMHVPIKGEKEVFDIINGYGTNLQLAFSARYAPASVSCASSITSAAARW